MCSFGKKKIEFILLFSHSFHLLIQQLFAEHTLRARCVLATWTQSPFLKELITVAHTRTTECETEDTEACIGRNGSIEEDAPTFEGRMAELGFEGETDVYQVDKGETSFRSREVKDV